MKIQKMDGKIVEIENIKTYNWVTGEYEYDLVYDKDGDLFGVIADDIDQEILDDIVERPYSYDFPVTVSEYLENSIGGDKMKEKRELTIEEEFEQHMKDMEGHVCYGCSGCKYAYYEVCPYVQEG